MKKKIVVIGGGNGTAIVLQALKPHHEELAISAVISMSDSGGSSGKLREEFHTLPTGDIMRAVLSLSRYDYPILKKIFYENRFSEVGKLNVHNVGNLFLVLAQQYGGDFISGIRALSQAVESVGYVYPATLDITDLRAELTSGEIVRGEAKIDIPDYDRCKKIVRVWLEPAGRIYEAAKNVIISADYIIFGIGSLFTSVIPPLLADGAQEALQNSKAKFIYVLGGHYAIERETGPTKASEFLAILQQYLPGPIDIFILSRPENISASQQKYYEEKKWGLIEYDKENVVCPIVSAQDLQKEQGGTDHRKLGKVLMEIITPPILPLI